MPPVPSQVKLFLDLIIALLDLLGNNRVGMYAGLFPAVRELHLSARSTSPGKILLRLVALCSQCFGVGLFSASCAAYS